MIAQHRIPDQTTETTQVKALLDIVDLGNAVVTADAAHAQRETADYIAGKIEDGGRDADYAVTVKGNQPGLQRDIYNKVTADCGTGPGHIEIDYSHGRIVKRSMWVTEAGGSEFRSQSRSTGSAATPATSTAPPCRRKSSTASPAWTRNASPPAILAHNRGQ